MNWLAHPATNYVFLALGLVLCLWLFVAVQREITSLKKARKSNQESSEQAFRQTWRRIEELEASMKELSEMSRDRPAPAPPQPGMNLNKRAQALRMSRRGQSPEQIARVLSLPRNEVDLLLKLNSAVSGEGSGDLSQSRQAPPATAR